MDARANAIRAQAWGKTDCVQSSRQRSGWHAARYGYLAAMMVVGGAALLVIVVSLALGLDGKTARLIWYPTAVVAIAIAVTLTLRNSRRRDEDDEDKAG
jgi:uncharacterized membrane protein